MGYRYNALDVASYFKWTSLPSYAEQTYLEFLYQFREDLFARPFSGTFASFSQAVFREMYHVWSRGFENEFSDVKRISPEGAIALFCEPDFLTLESYMKLLALHLIVSSRLPYIRIHLIGLSFLLGVEGSWQSYQRNLGLAADALELSLTDENGNEIDAKADVPRQPIRIALKDSLRLRVFGQSREDHRMINNYQEKMLKLKEQSVIEREKTETNKNNLHNKRRLRPDDDIKKSKPFELVVGVPEGVPKKVVKKSLVMKNEPSESKKSRKKNPNKKVAKPVKAHLEIVSEEPPPLAVTRIQKPSLENKDDKIH